MQELKLKLLNLLGFAFWIEIITENPTCTYYFGPFTRKQEAEAAKIGYLEDLQHEAAVIASLQIKRCQPHQLTVCDDREDGQFQAKFTIYQGSSSRRDRLMF